MNNWKEISIPIPVNFSFDETLSFLDRGFDECLYNLSDKAVSKLIGLSDGYGIINISQSGAKLMVILHKSEISKINLTEVRKYVSEWFDLERDIAPFYGLLSIYPKLTHIKNNYHGSRIIGIPNLFEAICWAIIGQQINLTFAYKLKRLLVEKYGNRIDSNDQIYYTFPTPKVLLQATREDLVEMKFSRQKIDYLKNISQAFIDNKVSKPILYSFNNQAERIESLVKVKGIGLWTANYVLLKCMRDMSCITYGDSGLNKAIHTIYGTAKRPTKDEIDAIFKDFKGWESYLNFYLWKSLT